MDFPIELEWFENKPTFRPEHPLRDWLPGAMRIPPATYIVSRKMRNARAVHA
jgi:hypothetical protein